MRGDRRQQPGELGVLAHVGLAEEDAALGIEPGGEQDRGRVVEALAQLGRVVGDRDRVQVDDAVDRLAALALGALLALDVLADRPDVVAEVLAPGRLDAAEDPHAQGIYSAASGPARGSAAGPLGAAAGRSAPRPHSPAVAADPGPGTGARSGGCSGLRTPSSAITPPTAISTAPIRIPRWNADSEESTMSASSAAASAPGLADVAAGQRLLLRAVDRRRRLGAQLLAGRAVVERRARTGPRRPRRGRRSPAPARPARPRC